MCLAVCMCVLINLILYYTYEYLPMCLYNTIIQVEGIQWEFAQRLYQERHEPGTVSYEVYSPGRLLQRMREELGQRGGEGVQFKPLSYYNVLYK